MLVARGIKGVSESVQVRLFEWMAGLAMIAGGAILLLPYNTFQNPVYDPMSRLMDEVGWGALMLMFGVLRIIVLFINGSWRRCSHARAALAFLCFGVWFTLFLCFLQIGTVGVGLSLAISLVVGEFITIFFAISTAAKMDANSAIRNARRS